MQCRESKILKKDTARQRRIKKESSDDCDIDDSTVGKRVGMDRREGGRIRRLRTSDQSTPGHEREGVRECETGRVWKGDDEEGKWEGER